MKHFGSIFFLLALALPSFAQDPVDTQLTEPQAVEPQTVESQAAEPQLAEPQSIEPEPAEPQSIEPQSTDTDLAQPERFRVSDILIDGHQRVSRGVIFAAFPVRIGDVVSPGILSDAVRELFKSGLFEDVELARDGNVLIVRVQELPAVSEITIEGNKAIKTDDLLKSLEENGLSEGQIFKQTTLQGMAASLEREYVNQGRYNASVKTEVTKLPRNQVKVDILVDEGKEARIKHINIVGNKSFSQEELQELFEIKTSGMFSWMSGNDKYSKEKLTGDIERLESWYLNRGYLEFSIDSAPVSISPNKETVYITVNITEGDIYTVNEVKLAGDPILPEDQVRRLILTREGQTFSQLLMTTSSDYITQVLGNEGYTFAETRGIPQANEEDKTVDITYFIDPGMRAYVRRIDFSGNTGTSDEVLRREMRQMEGGSASSARIEQSKVRLERLGYFKEVSVETVEVPGTADQIDVEYTVEEQAAGSIGFQVGYSDGYGPVIGANVTNNNWFGSGNQVSFAINHNRYQSSVNFNYTDPYFTPDGVTRGFGVYYTKSDYEEFNVSAFNTDRYGATVSFGYPLSEISTLGFSFGYENLFIDAGDYSSQEIKGSPDLFDPDVYAPYYYLNSELTSSAPPTIPTVTPLTANDPVLVDFTPGFLDLSGDEFDTFSFSVSWTQSALNRGVLATGGYSQQLSFELPFPGGDLEYFKLRYQGQYFQPLTKSLTLRLRTKLGYAGAYGNTARVPFFENFYAGGFGSVRGFERNTLGPRATPPVIYDTLPYRDVDNDGYIEYIYNLCDSIGAGCDSGEQGKLGSTQTYADLDRSFGGNVLVEVGAEVIFPLPFIKDQRSVQSSFFVEGGNVFDTDCGATQLNCMDKIRFENMSASFGIGLVWISGFGPLQFSVARPIQEQLFDETEFFQFTLGTSF